MLQIASQFLIHCHNFSNKNQKSLSILQIIPLNTHLTIKQDLHFDYYTYHSLFNDMFKYLLLQLS